MKKRTTKKRGLRGDYESRELELYITNEREVHPRLMAIETALDRKVKSGKFDKTKAPKAFRYVVDEAAKKYAKEFRVPVRNLFTVADKNAVAERLTKGYMGERGLKGLRGCGTSGCGPKSRGVKGLGSSSAEHLKRAEWHLDAAASYSFDYRASAKQGKCVSAYRHMSNLESSTTAYLANYHAMTPSAQLKFARKNAETIDFLEGTWGSLYKFENACLVKGSPSADFTVRPLSEPRVVLGSSLDGLKRRKRATKRKTR